MNDSHSTEPQGAFPNRIWIVGVCGSGKSTFADHLGTISGNPVTHLDDIHWNPGWVESEYEDDLARIASVVAKERWIIDGNYSKFRTMFESHIDLYIWLDFPFRITFWRLIKRSFNRVVLKQLACNGNQETIRQTLFSRNSILWWEIKTHRWRRKQLNRQLEDKPHLRFRTIRAVTAWEQSLPELASCSRT